MTVPALIYVAVNATASGGVLSGWAVPTATDIAFALAVLGVISTHLPVALRTFLLTLAVVDDVLAILIIALFYTASLNLLPLAAALVPLGLFAFLVRRRVRSWWLLRSQIGGGRVAVQEDDRVAGTALAVCHRQAMDANAPHRDSHQAMVHQSVAVGQRTSGRSARVWKPGTASGYHGMTFGFLVGEVVRRITGLTARFRMPG